MMYLLSVLFDILLEADNVGHSGDTASVRIKEHESVAGWKKYENK